LTDSLGRPLLGTVAGGAQMTLLGFPVALDNYLADGEVVFGDLKEFIIRRAGAVILQKNVDFRSGSTIIRAAEHIDSGIGLVEAFARVTYDI
jgi:HK97 family phage major capsid protein